MKILSVLALVLLTACAEEQTEPTVIIVGDSTVASQPSTNDGQGWGYFFEKNVPNVINHARSGRSSKSFMDEGLWDRALEDEPDIVLIQFGLNDIKDDHRYTEPETTFKEYLRQYYDDAREIDASVIFVLSSDRFNGNPNTVEEYATAMREFAESVNAPVIDLFSYSHEMNLAYNIEQIYTDDTHPNQLGADIFSEFIQIKFDEIKDRL